MTLQARLHLILIVIALTANYSSGVDTGSSYQSASTDQDSTASSHTPTTPSSSSDALAADESSSSGSGSLVPPANINPQT